MATSNGVSSRRRRRSATHVSLRRAVYDNTAVALLVAVPVLGMILFGGVRVWSIGSLMILCYLGVALFLLRPLFALDMCRMQVPPAGFLFLLFFFYALAQIPFAAVPYEAKIEWLKIGSYIGAYWAWSEWGSRHKRWRVVVAILLLAGSLVSWYALIQHARGTRMVLTLVRPESYGMRASGTYICPNHFASMLNILLCMGLAVACMRGAWVPLRLFGGYSAVLFIPTVYLTQSRSGWIGAVVGMALTFWIILWKKNRKLFYVMLVLIPIGVLCLGAVLWSVSDVARERMQGAELSNPDTAVQARLLMWKDTLQMIREKPFVGHGGGAYRWVYPHYKSHDLQFWFRYAHNEYLHLLAEYGAIGFALVAVSIVWFFVRMLGLLRSVDGDRELCLIAGLTGAVGASFAHALFDFNLHVFSVAHALVLFAGLVVGVLYAGGRLDAKPLPSGKLRALNAAVALVSFALALICAQAVGSYTLTRMGNSRNKALQRESAEKLFAQAVQLDPGNWEPWLGLGNIYRTRSFWSHVPEERTEYGEQALRYCDKAFARNPFDLAVRYGKSQAYASLGETQLSLETLREIVEFAPREYFFIKQLGLRLRKEGQYKEALRVFDRAAEINANDEVVRINRRILRERLNAD